MNDTTSNICTWEYNLMRSREAEFRNIFVPFHFWDALVNETMVSFMQVESRVGNYFYCFSWANYVVQHEWKSLQQNMLHPFFDLLSSWLYDESSSGSPPRGCSVLVCSSPCVRADPGLPVHAHEAVPVVMVDSTSGYLCCRKDEEEGRPTVCSHPF